MNDKIIKLLALADSSNDNEALVAFRTARKIMQTNNMDWSSVFRQKRTEYETSFAEVTKLMKMKLQLQQECYAIQDEISKHESYLQLLKKKVSVAEGEKEGFAESKYSPSPGDIDDAFEKIFYAIGSYSNKKNEFLESLRFQWKEKKWLSPKQISCLRENFVRYMGFEPAW